MDVNIRVAGEAGQGVLTTGHLLVGVLAKMGLHVLATQSYMSRIRGGLNWFDIRISDAELFSGTENADLLVALTPEALQVLSPEVTADGVVLFDGESTDGPVGLQFTKVAKELAASAIMANTVAAGAAFAVLGYDVAELCGYLEHEFEKKGSDVVEKNLLCARRGAGLALESNRTVKAPSPAGAPANVYNGAQAVGLAAATAGVKFVTAYPMTPATAVFTYLADVADKYGIVVEQAEDEIAAVNMVCGAVYGGVPAMTVTSGGGFALMVEGVSLAGIMELPMVIMVGQRPGPATGLPTRTAQQDLKFVLYSGHGEFARAIYAPGTIRQAYELTRHALETAHKYQTPVFILTDEFIADMQKNIPPLDSELRPIDRHIVESPPRDYIRYAVTGDGISPRAIPGGEAFVVCDSDEHTADGHITEDLRARVSQQDKRMAKIKGLRAESLPAELYGPAEAETLLLTWGSTYGPAREAVDILNLDGVSAAMLHFSQVWPVNAPAVRGALERRRRVVSVEGNQTGQLASLLREVGLLSECELMTRYDGLPFTGREIAARVKS